MRHCQARLGVRPGGGAGGVLTTSGLALDPSDNKPIVAFKDMSAIGGGRPHVLKWSSGTTWTDCGDVTSGGPGGGADKSIAFDPSDNELVVAYIDETCVVRVKKGSLP